VQRRKFDDALFSDGSKSGFKPLVLLSGRMECNSKNVVVIKTTFLCSL